MDPTQQALIRESFARLAPVSSQVGTMFYERMFAIDPGLRPLFKIGIARQGELLMGVLATAVANLHQLDQILPAVRDLGRRHVGYGVIDSDYDTGAAALVATLETALGDDFTPPVRNAWVACYRALTGEMRAAASAA